MDLLAAILTLLTAARLASSENHPPTTTPVAAETESKPPRDPAKNYPPHTVYSYPYRMDYFYPGVVPESQPAAPPYPVANGYVSSVIPAAQVGLEIMGNVFLYFLVRRLLLKILDFFSLVLDVRDALVDKDTTSLTTKTALRAVFKLFAKVGLYLVGGVALLAVGGIFTTLLCNLTPICTISFNGYDLKALDKETVRSLMTPDKIATAAALVQDAIGKYQRLQRAVGQ